MHLMQQPGKAQETTWICTFSAQQAVDQQFCLLLFDDCTVLMAIVRGVEYPLVPVDRHQKTEVQTVFM